MKQIVVASSNTGKIKEIHHALSEFPVTLLPQTQLGVTEVAEDGLSFVENALIKARNAARQTALPAMADDSGIVVPVLNGRPGMYSARFAGPGASDQQNIQKLLNELAAKTNTDRRAYYYCALVYVNNADDPMPIIALGKWSGTITSTPSGNGGFGYDPIFYVPQHACTAAELAPEEKNRLSHRGQALASFVSQYREIYGE